MFRLGNGQAGKAGEMGRWEGRKLGRDGNQNKCLNRLCDIEPFKKSKCIYRISMTSPNERLLGQALTIMYCVAQTNHNGRPLDGRMIHII